MPVPVEPEVAVVALVLVDPELAVVPVVAPPPAPVAVAVAVAVLPPADAVALVVSLGAPPDPVDPAALVVPAAVASMTFCEHAAARAVSARLAANHLSLIAMAHATIDRAGSASYPRRLLVPVFFAARGVFDFLPTATRTFLPSKATANA